MDISKIRKKAREKARNAEEKISPETPAQSEIRTEQPLAEIGVPELPAELPEMPAEEISVPEQSEPAGKREVPEEGDEPEQALELLELLTFRLANEEFAFKVSEIEEIIRHQSITTVPTLPDYISGITSLRGKIIPVLDLKKRLVLKAAAGEPDSGGELKDKILIVDGPKGFIGAAVDKVVGVVRLPYSDVLEPPAHLSEEELRFIEGVVIIDKRFISVIRSEDALNIEVK